VENPLTLWENLSTPMKVLVGAALAGIGIFAFIKIKSGSTPAGSTVSSTGVLSGTNGAVDISSLLAGLGYDASTGSANAAGGNVQTAGQTANGNSSIPPAVAPTVSASAPKPPQSAMQYVTVQAWHPGATNDSTLGNIASNHGISGGALALARLNPQISNINSLSVGQQVRIR
jgi:hypothetical protein